MTSDKMREDAEEEFMKTWDKARVMVANGSKSSLPRDMIEAALETYRERIAEEYLGSGKV